MSKPQEWVPPMWQIDLLLPSHPEHIREIRTALESSKPIKILQCPRRHTLGRVYDVVKFGPVLIFSGTETFAIANRGPTNPDPNTGGFRIHRSQQQAAPIDPAHDERIDATRNEQQLAAAEHEWVDMQCRCRHGRLTRADLRELVAVGPQRTVVHLH